MNCITSKVKKKTGIYKITNKINGKCYIGQSVHVIQRICDHKRHLRNEDHINEHLQRAYNKYGIDSFVYEFIEECNREQLDDKELFWIDFFNSTDRGLGYNLADGGNLRGLVHESTKKKMSIINRGINNILQEQDVKEIKDLLIKGVTQTELSLRYNVTQSSIWRIMNLDNWKWVTPELNGKLKELPNKVKEDREGEVRLLSSKGWSNKKITTHLRMDGRTVSGVVPSTYIEDHRKTANLVREDYKNDVPIEDTLIKYNIKRSTYSKHTKELRHEHDKKLHEDILSLHGRDVMVKDIANQLGIHRTTVTNHVKGRGKDNQA